LSGTARRKKREDEREKEEFFAEAKRNHRRNGNFNTFEKIDGDTPDAKKSKWNSFVTKKRPLFSPIFAPPRL
jgi:hypothetical protein